MVLGIGGRRDNEPTATPGAYLEKLHSGAPAGPPDRWIFDPVEEKLAVAATNP